MTVMVTGGAGYIGAHSTLALAGRGDTVVVVDDLVSGVASRIPGIPLVRVDLAGDDAVDRLVETMEKYEVDAVIHFAARKRVGESVERPAWYYQQNVGGLASVLLAMERTGVRRLVFSSSAAVYGEAHGAIDESHPTVPVNPYGGTKLVGEQLIDDCVVAWGLSAVSLRYFNVGGAGSPELGDVEAQNLIPLVFDRIEAGEPPVIFGDDYDTPDGTCVRDYIHVSDVTSAHLTVLDRLRDAEGGHTVLNIGTGTGTSVREVVAVISDVVGSEVQPRIEPRRAGDAAAVVAVVDRVHELTGWRATHTLDDIVRSSWAARSSQTA
jgi:UDP-glucose 4-epimerase